jgi:hypothetical protein
MIRPEIILLPVKGRRNHSALELDGRALVPSSRPERSLARTAT